MSIICAAGFVISCLCFMPGLPLAFDWCERRGIELGAIYEDPTKYKSGRILSPEKDTNDA